MIVLRVATGIRSHFVTRLPEWICAAELLAEGGQLIRSDTFASTHVYRSVHLLVGSEDRWGGIGVSIAALWLFALLLNGTFPWFRRVSPWVRSMSAFCASAYWAIWAVAMLYGNPAGTGGINHAGFAALAAAYSILTAREVGMAERTARQCRARSPDTLKTAAETLGMGFATVFVLWIKSYFTGKAEDGGGSTKHVILEQAELRPLGELPEQLRNVSSKLQEVFDVERTNRDAIVGQTATMARIEAMTGENNKILRKLEVDSEVEQRMAREARRRDDEDRPSHR